MWHFSRYICHFLWLPSSPITTSDGNGPLRHQLDSTCGTGPRFPSDSFRFAIALLFFSHLRRVTFDSTVDCLSSPAPLCLFCRSETWRRWLFRRKAQGHLTYDYVACKWILWTGCSTTVVCGTVKVVTPFCRVVVCNPATSSADQSRKKGLWYVQSSGIHIFL